MATRQSTQRLWEGKVKRAQTIAEDWRKEFRVELARKYFEGKQKEAGWSDAEWITVNKIFTRLTAALPSLVDAKPFFYVKLKKSFSPNPLDIALFQAKGSVRQSMINYIWTDIEATLTARLAVQDAFFSYGVLKIHHSARFSENPRAGSPILSDEPDDEGVQSPLLDDDGEPLIEPDQLPTDEQYHVTRVHPDDFIWGDDCGPLEQKWTWVAERIRMSEESAKKDPRFTSANVPKGGATDKDPINRDPITNKPRDKDDSEQVVLWEIYDLKNRQWMVIAENAEKPLMNWKPFPEGVEEHPYSTLRFVLRDNSPYPIPPVSQAMSPQKELNESRSRILRHRKRFNRKYEVNVNVLLDPEDDMAALTHGDDGAVLKKKGPEQAVHAISDAPLDQQTYTEIALLNADIVEVLGPQSGDIARADSATAAALIDKGEDVKEGDKKSMVVALIVKAARKLDQLVQATLTTEQAIRVAGPSGEAWELVRPQDYEQIAGEFEFSMNAGAAVPRLPQIERAQFMALLGVLGQVPLFMTSERMMRKLFEMHQIDDDAMLKDLMKIGQQMFNAQQQGGGEGQANPISALLGSALGDQGGITGGGGAPQLAQAV